MRVTIFKTGILQTRYVSYARACEKQRLGLSETLTGKSERKRMSVVIHVIVNAVPMISFARVSSSPHAVNRRRSLSHYGDQTTAPSGPFGSPPRPKQNIIYARTSLLRGGVHELFIAPSPPLPDRPQ